MYLIVGLGNPGLSYKKTRHNAGFQALDALAERLGVRVKTKGFSALYGEGRIGNERVVLMKPQTYMNLSGDAVQSLMHFYKLAPEQLIVLYDDVDLPIGSLRIRANGSAGTHNGMRSVIACVGSENFPRIRIGVGKDESLQLRDYVLKRPSKAEQQTLGEVYAHAADAAELIVAGNINEAQTKYNKKHEKTRSVSIDGHHEKE
ncbi:MAG: aminoacyl-tRNA hydrolase [Clostridia bacterium]|nr:aminoacyl-tRNA hydrolase [Clostridia bacterium]